MKIKLSLEVKLDVARTIVALTGFMIALESFLRCF
ncbi:hypothetical protein TDB9533_00403 [Thalassocella blandensis]|nr:hypothetical protein TDB9533_00403 [Thalassocella blandensis]